MSNMPRWMGLQELADLVDEAAEAGWDGPGASPVSPSAVAEAQLFLSRLPSSIPSPAAAAEPDGSVGMEWRVPRRGRVAVSLDGRMRLSHVSLHADGSVRRGVEPFVQEPPRVVVQALVDLIEGATG
jgi:hypothetical protein